MLLAPTALAVDGVRVMSIPKVDVLLKLAKPSKVFAFNGTAADKLADTFDADPLVVDKTWMLLVQIFRSL